MTRAACALLLAGLLLAGCGSGATPLQQGDPQLMARAERVTTAAPLREITGGDWDRVHVFPGYASRDLVESTVGADVDMPDVYAGETGGILVFERDGEPRWAVVLPDWPFDGTAASYGPGAVATRTGGFLRLTDTRES